MPPSVPKNGHLSGMIIPAAAAGVLPVALVWPAFRARFAAGLSPAFLGAFLLSAVVMALHKAESFWAGEFDQCPVYLTSGQAAWAQNPRKAIFLAFVPTFIGMLLVASLALIGPPWHLLILTIWLGQGLHELHHSAKSVARRRFYPGVFTSLIFVAVVSFGVFPRWYGAVVGSRGAIFYGYYALIPFVWLAFYAEDRSWISRADPAIWNP
jgi:hypothetical protein